MNLSDDELENICIPVTGSSTSNGERNSGPNRLQPFIFCNIEKKDCYHNV